MQRRQRAHRKGVLAEWWCMAWLLLKGYSLLSCRYKVPQGEIDIIAVRGQTLVFIEVKARAKYEDGLFSITPEKRYRTERAAQQFVATNKKFVQHSLRFDVMVVTSLWRIIHLKNAWSVA